MGLHKTNTVTTPGIIKENLMRRFTAWTGLGVLLIVLGLSGITGTKVDSQQASTDQPQDGTELDQGHKAFDIAAQFEFEHSLSAFERESLVALRSRYDLADPNLPLPTGEPEQVFYVKFRQPMGRQFANALKEAGASFVGYAALNTHFVRARSAEALESIEALLRGNPNVAGTLLRAPEDACDERTWAEYHDPDLHHGAYRILFWQDVSATDAEMLLAEWGAGLLEASTDANGRIDLETPFVIATLERAAFRHAVTHPWVEIIEHAPEYVTHNVDSQALHRARLQDVGVTPYNLSGQGLVVGVWDGGSARSTHNAFQNAGVGSPFASISGHASGSRVLRGNPTTSLSSHATHVTGTIVSDGTGMSGGRGYAPNAHAVSYYWNSMQSERRAARYNWRIVTDNHSYGATNVSAGGYNSEAASNDLETRDLLLNMFKAAGNSGPNSYTTGSDGCSKNTFLIGATTDAGDIAGFSSRGPSVDGRVIPHFTANGTSLLSTHSQSDGAWAQQGWSGTSMASPSAAGGVTLLTELWHREMDNQMFSPDVARGVLAATVDDRGNLGPDYQYGYGLLDIQRAADLIMDHASTGNHILRGQVRQNEVLEYPLMVTSSASSLKVVMSWMDIWASTSASVVLVNNLDIELIEPNGVTRHYPWRGLQSQQGNQTHQFTRTGPNSRDNLLVVDVGSPTVGQWTIRVTGTNVPSNPQASVLNDIVGFVLVSEHEIGHEKHFVGDPLNTTGPVSIPDNNATGVTRTFNVTAGGTIQQVRLYCDIRHPARGDLDIYLIHPDNTTSHIQQRTTSTRADMIAIMPDTRQYYDEVDQFVGKSPTGVWQVRVTDTRSGQVGTIEHLALEIDINSSGVPGNLPPVADAGTNQQVNEGSLVQLDASGSSDPDGDPLTYLWMQTDGPAVTLDDETAVNPTFTAPMVPYNLHVRFLLTVNDGRGGSDTDTVTITVMDQPTGTNNPPVADAGPDIVVVSGDIGVLDGSNSFDPDGDPLTYLWTVTGGNMGLITLSDPTVAVPDFVAPPVGGNQFVLFQLTVDDGNGAQASDTVLVTIHPDTSGPSPVADAGQDRAVAWDSTVELDGTNSQHPSGGILAYLWEQIEGDNVVALTGEDTATPSFVAPGEDDVLVFRLRVTDENTNMDSTTVRITVNETGTSGDDGGSRRSSDKDDDGCTVGPVGGGARFWLIFAGLVCLGAAFRCGTNGRLETR
jgi:subtilisin-like proprotein convertase family protein